MTEIGYGCSRDQISNAVREIIERGHCPNPVYGFLTLWLPIMSVIYGFITHVLQIWTSKTEWKCNDHVLCSSIFMLHKQLLFLSKIVILPCIIRMFGNWLICLFIGFLSGCTLLYWCSCLVTGSL